MTDSCDPFDRHGNRRDSKKYYPDYRTRVCLTCGSEIYAPASRIGHVLSMHIDRCATATAAGNPVEIEPHPIVGMILADLRALGFTYFGPADETHTVFGRHRLKEAGVTFTHGLKRQFVESKLSRNHG